MTGSAAPDEFSDRKRWMSVLGRAERGQLEDAFERLGGIPDHSVLKAEDTGTVMVEGRAGGGGRRFNLGEATVTRCVVKAGDRVGVSYAMGRDKRKARLAAVLDALLQDESRRPAIEAEVIAPLEARQREIRDVASRKAAATKVEFFTLVRGDA